MKKATRILVPLILLLFICASIVWYLFVYDREFTRDTLLSQARFQDLHGNSQLSSLFYDMAYEFSSQEEGVAIELANHCIPPSVRFLWNRIRFWTLLTCWKTFPIRK